MKADVREFLRRGGELWHDAKSTLRLRCTETTRLCIVASEEEDDTQFKTATHALLTRLQEEAGATESWVIVDQPDGLFENRFHGKFADYYRMGYDTRHVFFAPKKDWGKLLHGIVWHNPKSSLAHVAVAYTTEDAGAHKHDVASDWRNDIRRICAHAKLSKKAVTEDYNTADAGDTYRANVVQAVANRLMAQTDELTDMITRVHGTTTLQQRRHVAVAVSDILKECIKTDWFPIEGKNASETNIVHHALQYVRQWCIGFLQRKHADDSIAARVGHGARARLDATISLNKAKERWLDQSSTPTSTTSTPPAVDAAPAVDGTDDIDDMDASGTKRIAVCMFMVAQAETTTAELEKVRCRHQDVLRVHGVRQRTDYELVLGASSAASLENNKYTVDATLDKGFTKWWKTARATMDKLDTGGNRPCEISLFGDWYWWQQNFHGPASYYTDMHKFAEDAVCSVHCILMVVFPFQDKHTGIQETDAYNTNLTGWMATQHTQFDKHFMTLEEAKLVHPLYLGSEFADMTFGENRMKTKMLTNVNNALSGENRVQKFIVVCRKGLDWKRELQNRITYIVEPHVE